MNHKQTIQRIQNTTVLAFGRVKIVLVISLSVLLSFTGCGLAQKIVASQVFGLEEEAALSALTKPDTSVGTAEVEESGISAGTDEAESDSDSMNPLSVDERTNWRGDEILTDMSLQDKVAQLFVVTPEALTGVNGVTMAGSMTEQAFDAYPVGGVIYMEQNLLSREQVSQMLSSMKQISMKRTGLPVFLAVDEEGGSVRRVSGHLEDTPYIPDMLSVGATQDPLQAYQVGNTIGGYLNLLGFNVDFAPVADVLTNPENTVIGTRSFGTDSGLVSEMVALEVQGLQEQGVCATLKHFPGHGNTFEDSHQGIAVSYKTLDELQNCELLPFKRGVDAGAEFVMAGHVAMPNITGDQTPASLSHQMLTDILRGELGFQGIIITDALGMGAVSNVYDSSEAAALAFLAGADLLLMPADFHSAYNGMLNAVQNGRISQERLDESLRRIIRLKLRMMDQIMTA